MLSCQMGEEWLRPAEFSHPKADRPQVVGPVPEVNRCKTLIDVQNSPELHPDRSNKIFLSTRNLSNLHPGKQEVL